jgi:uncharacterized protein (DUF58 family)
MHSKLFHKVRHIEFVAKQQVLDTFSGMYASAFKGHGVELDDIREFQNGDDVRAISWAKSAQMGRPYVKTFREERDLTVMLVADVSGSLSFGSHYETKRERLAEVGALLAFSAMYNHDKVGLLLFSDHIEKMILPKRGMRQGALVVRELLAFEAAGKKTDIAKALDCLNKTLPKRAIVFLLSDFLDDGYEREFRYTAKKEDLIAVRLFDPLEKALLPVGACHFEDIETGTSYLVDLTKELVEQEALEEDVRRDKLKALSYKSNAGLIEIDTKESFIEKIGTYFALRKKFRR